MPEKGIFVVLWRDAFEPAVLYEHQSGAATAGPGGFIADPDHPPVRYRLTGADKATFHSHWHLTAELHA